VIASSAAWLVPAGSVFVIALVVVYRWLWSLTNRMNDHGERISWLEAKINGKDSDKH